jgi:predicted Fe-Mo cluster-binding NifX family protein
MKIAAVTDDGVTISQHFGRAQKYAVITVENGKIVSQELRDKLAHSQIVGESGHEHAHGADARGHGFDPASQDRHARMTTPIADCEVLLARGMGAGAYQSLVNAGIRPIVTDVADIVRAVQDYVARGLTDHTERLH